MRKAIMAGVAVVGIAAAGGIVLTAQQDQQPKAANVAAATAPAAAQRTAEEAPAQALATPSAATSAAPVKAARPAAPAPMRSAPPTVSRAELERARQLAQDDARRLTSERDAAYDAADRAAYEAEEARRLAQLERDRRYAAEDRAAYERQARIRAELEAERLDRERWYAARYDRYALERYLEDCRRGVVIGRYRGEAEAAWRRLTPTASHPPISRPPLDRPPLDRPMTDNPRTDRPPLDRPPLDRPLVDRPVRPTERPTERPIDIADTPPTPPPPTPTPPTPAPPTPAPPPSRVESAPLAIADGVQIRRERDAD